jgi:hypothetical protein
MADLSTTKIYGDLTVSNNIKGYRIANLDDISVIYENRSITAGNGLSGGGALSNNLAISMGTPSTLTASTTNSLSTTSHTHAITGFTKTTVPAAAGNLASLLLDGNLADSGYNSASFTAASHVGTTGTAHGAATTSVNGFMSSADKTKLNGIATNANNYSLPTATASVLGGVKIGTNVEVSSGTISVPSASKTKDGVITNSTQELKGNKSLDGVLTMNDSSGNAGFSMEYNNETQSLMFTFIG